MEFLSFFGIVGLFIFLGSISGRISNIERKLRGEEVATSETKHQAQGTYGAQDAGTQAVQTQTAAEVAQGGVFVRGQSQAAHSATAQASVSREPDVFERFIMWIKEDWLMKLGALLVLLAIGWFAQYAFTNEWISELGQILIGLVVGVGVMLGGYYWSAGHKAQGGVLIALGSAMVLTVMFIAREVFDLFNPTVALFAMFMSVAFAMLCALKFSNRALAFTSVALAAAAPLLTNSPDPSFFTIFPYLLVVALGSLWVVYLTQWRELVLENFIIVTLFSMPYWVGSVFTKPSLDEMMFAFVFAGVFFIASMVGILRGKGVVTRGADMLTAFGTGGFIFVWTMVAAPSELHTFILLAWTLVFAFGSYSVYAGTRQMAPFILYGGVATALVAFATAVEFDGAVLMMAYSAEIAIVTVTSMLLTGRRRAAAGSASLFIVPVLMSIEHLTSQQWSYSVTFDGAIAVYTLVAVMVATAITVMVLSPLPADSEPDKVTMPGVLLGTSALYLFILIWLIPHALSAHTVATTISLVTYTIIGLTAYFAAEGKYERTLHWFGQLVLVGVVARLLLVDVWSLTIAGRIVVFALVGVALISTAFAARNRKQS